MAIILKEPMRTFKLTQVGYPCYFVPQMKPVLILIVHGRLQRSFFHLILRLKHNMSIAMGEEM